MDFPSLPCDVLIHVISFLNVTDSCRFSRTSRRSYYLVNESLRLLGTELVAYSSWDPVTRRNQSADELIWEGRSRLHGRPNLVLTFDTNGRRPSLLERHQHDLPRDAVLLGATARTIQANLSSEVQNSSNVAVMMGSFPTENTKMVPFRFADVSDQDPANSLRRVLEGATPPGQESYWSVFIVYCAGFSSQHSCHSFVRTLQNHFPESIIVGGICEGGHVRTMQGGESSFHHVEEGIFGVALGGDVPVKTIVSRGVTSMSDSSPWLVNEAVVLNPDHRDYPFNPGQGFGPVHIIQSIRNASGTIAPAYNFPGLLSSIEGADFIGVCRPDHDGFELHSCGLLEEGIFLECEEDDDSLVGANIDFFVLDGPACLQDIDHTLQKLSVATKDDKILGALMFSCSGREASLMGEELADATRFHKYFPNVPCLGFYAGGEIGPLALAGDRDNLFRRGRSCVQGFTAVFALFIVPDTKPKCCALDDGEENVARYVKARLTLK